MQACDEEKLLGHLGVVLYEYLGEEYPDVLGSILGALKAIVNVIGMTVRSRHVLHPFPMVSRLGRATNLAFNTFFQPACVKSCLGFVADGRHASEPSSLSALSSMVTAPVHACAGRLSRLQTSDESSGGSKF